MKVERIGVLSSGGDCPGINAVIRAVVKSAILDYGVEVIGIKDGFRGLLLPPQTMPLGRAEVRGLLPRGGTILGTSNRGNPFAWPDGAGGTTDRSREIVDTAASLGIDVVVVIGGDGSLRIGRDLAARGLPIVGVPKTIDNDISLTDLTFGFDSAIVTATDAIDKLHTTTESHHRVMVVEVMGRTVGWIALVAGIAGGADVILIPEIPYSLDAVVAKIEERVSRGSRFSIVVVAEGALPKDGEASFIDAAEGRFGGVGERVAAAIGERTGREVRTTVLGHLQRGGSPSPYDRVLASRFGAAATRLAVTGGTGRMVALTGTFITDVAIVDAVAKVKTVPVDGELAKTALSLGISLGEA